MTRIAVLLCIVESVAFAQPTDPKPDPKPVEAKPPLSKFDTSKVEAMFDRGTKHYDLGEWDAAIAAFKQAYALMPDPSFLYNLGQSFRQKGACREATAAYKSYLRNAPDDDRGKVEQFVRELDPCVKVEEEKARRLLPPPELSPRHRTLRRAGLITTGAGMLVLGGASFFAVRAVRTESESERCNTNPCAGSRVIDLDRKGQAAERNALVLGVIGAAVVATGATLYLYTRVRGEYITVTPTGGGGLVTLGHSF
jgi:tetratricopeptide (TPR) repeat protein